MSDNNTLMTGNSKADPTAKRTAQGRPRDKTLDAAILDATILLLAETGYDAMSMELIARRLGCSRSSIYRRFPDKAALVAAAVTRQFELANPVVPETGDAIQDITRLLFNTARMLTESPVGAVIKALITVLDKDAELGRLAKEMEKGRRQYLLDAIARGAARGEISDTQTDQKIDAALGAIYLRYLLLQKPVTRRYVQELTETLFR
ncbi:MAG: TetR/AcrR family transcriptional regulator [Pseudomonadales bacterium]|nr:TetR/AcrR family transcriptional regulator [Pseudomonadales bacterium]